MSATHPTPFLEELSDALPGRVLADPVSQLIYSTDVSLYQIRPAAVAIPANRDELAAAVRIAAAHRMPILPRGAGTSLAGQTVGPGLVLDCSKHLNRIIEVNREERWVRLEPGVVLDQLNDHLSPLGLFFAPDVATSSRANLGGMLGNNSSGMRSLRYGKTVDHVLELTALLSTGEIITFRELDRPALDALCAGDDTAARIHDGVRRLVAEHRDEIRTRYPRVMRRVSGYNLDELLDENRFNLSRLLVGSEGTLAVIVEAKLRLEPLPEARAVVVLHFHRLMDSIRLVPRLLVHQPTAVELLDRYGLELARSNPSVAGLARRFLQGDPDAILMLEFSGSPAELQEQMERLKRDAAVQAVCFAAVEAWEPGLQQAVWQVRKNALGVMLGIRGDFKPVPFIEDSCVPVEVLADYVSDVQQICKEHGRRLALYAHAGVGVIHLRPILNLKQEEDVRILASISEQVFQRVVHYRGSWSGEHGDGLSRSYKLREFFGDRLYEAFRRVKELFDPAGLMNPGKILDAPPPTENLRISPTYRPVVPATFYRFADEGGMGAAIELCTGVGQCRKLSGVMCPSYIVTREEEHSTRGRANALRSAIAGELGRDGLTSDRLYEVLDLCLECKACKSECPSNVDMAKLKAEFLAHYYQRHGLPLRRRLIGATRRIAETATLVPRLANMAMGNPVARRILEAAAGLDRRRVPPRFAHQSLGAWYRSHYRPLPEGRLVTLLADTFTNYFEPEAGVAAIRLLEAVGCRVRLIDWACCGRPLISSGRLDRAREEGDRTLPGLLEAEGRLVVLEPSCFATFRDDWPDLLTDVQGAKQLAARVCTLEEILTENGVAEALASRLQGGPPRILYHGHCQQRAVLGMAPTVAMLRLLPASHVDEVPPGCCGMAGVFGYEREHYDLSRQIGELHLLPAVRSAGSDTRLVASGFSCRSQIRHFTGRTAVHPAVALAENLG